METNLLIRDMAKHDNQQIAFIIRSVLKEFKADKPGTVYFDPTTDDLFTLFKTPRSKYFIAELENEMIGGAGVFPTPDLPQGYCELVKLYLLPGARSKGFGKILMEQCFATAHQFGYTHLYLESMPELSIAVGLYEKCGFKHLISPLGNSSHFGCSIWMLKEL